MISKEVFCNALRLIKEQENIEEEVWGVLQKAGSRYYVLGESKYLEALLLVLKNTMNDQYDYIS